MSIAVADGDGVDALEIERGHCDRRAARRENVLIPMNDRVNVVHQRLQRHAYEWDQAGVLV